MVRRRTKTIDERYMGLEPEWNDENPPPTDIGQRQLAFTKASHWYNYYCDKKKFVKTVLAYCEKVLKFSKEDMQAMKKLPDWKVYMKHHTFVKLQERGWNYEKERIKSGNADLRKLLKEGHVILKELGIQKEAKPKVVIISPHERQRIKVMETIVGDWDEMVIDKWVDGIYDKKLVKFPTYSLFQFHNLKGSAVGIFKEQIMMEYDLVKDAYDKTCEQAVEAYSHVKKGDKKKMLTLMEGIFEDLERVKSSAKSTRTANKKPRAKEDQVKRLKYLKEDIDSKVVSIAPEYIPTRGKLYMYNVKTRKLTEFTTNSTSGFEVKGSTLHNWDEKISRITTLRKPDEILPQILNKTEKQINNLWDKFTTKISVPTGRINKDTILLRVEDYTR